MCPGLRPIPWLDVDGGRAVRPDGGRDPDDGRVPELGLLLPPRYDRGVVPDVGRADVGRVGMVDGEGDIRVLLLPS